MKKLLTAVLTVTLLLSSNLFAQSENVNVADFGFWETPADSSTSFDAKSGMLSLGAWKGGGIWFGKDVSNCDTLTFTYKNNKAPANLTLNYINDEKAEREIPAGSGSLVINLDKAKINKDGQYIGIQAKGEDTSMQIVSIVFAIVSILGTITISIGLALEMNWAIIVIGIALVLGGEIIPRVLHKKGDKEFN